jgi:enoyl-CoA hydratase/carnithine racemase
MPEYQHIDVNTDGRGVCTIRLDREHHYAHGDALNPDMIKELSQAFTEAEKSAEVIVLRAKEIEKDGGVFSAGMDLPYLRQCMVEPQLTERIKMLRPLAELFDQMDHCTKPIIGVADGPAIGAGATLLALCDHVIATPDLKIGYPERNMDIYPSLSAIYAIRRMRAEFAGNWFQSGHIFNCHKPADKASVENSGMIDVFRDDGPKLQAAIHTAVDEALRDKENFMKNSRKRKKVEMIEYPVTDSYHGRIADLVNNVTILYQERDEAGRQRLINFSAWHLAKDLTQDKLPQLDAHLREIVAHKKEKTDLPSRGIPKNSRIGMDGSGGTHARR